MEDTKEGVKKTTGMIYQRMARILADCTHIGKDRENKQQNYKFRGIDDTYNMLHEHFAKNEVFVMPKVLKESREERQTKNGGVSIYTILRVRFKFYSTDGSSVKCETVGEAADSGDKSSNKAMSTAMKYALIMVFLIPTEGDNDSENHSPEFLPRGSQQPKAPQPEPDYTALDARYTQMLKDVSSAETMNAVLADLKAQNLMLRYGQWVQDKAAVLGLVWSETFQSYGEPVPATDEEIKKAVADLANCKSINDIKTLISQLPPATWRDQRFKDAAKERQKTLLNPQPAPVAAN